MRTRTSDAHWAKLSMILSSFERCAEMCARLDAYRSEHPSVKGEHSAIHAFDCRVNAVRDLIDREMDRSTVERLTVDLARKKRL